MGHWRNRSATVLLLCVLAGLGAAGWGLHQGMPPAPYGDESRYWWMLTQEALRVVWTPWQPLIEDAHAPAGWGRFALLVFVLWLGLEAALYLARNILRAMQMVRRGGHHILGSVSPLASRLVSDWAGQGRPVLVVTPAEADLQVAVSAGAAVLRGVWDGSRMFEKAALARAATLTLAAESDLDNLEMATAAATYVTDHRDADSPPLHMLLHVGDPFLRATIDERIDRFGRLESVQLRLISTSQIAARRLLREHPVDRLQHDARAGVHVWIIGLGQWGEDLALAVLRTAHYRHGHKPRLTLVDREAQARRSSMLARWPGLERAGDLQFIDAEAESPSAMCDQLLAACAAVGHEPTAIYCCLARAEGNAALALTINDALTEAGRVVPPIYVRGRAVGDVLTQGNVWMHGFGDLNWVAESVLKVEGVLDHLARHIHERYLEEAKARKELMGARRALRPWLLLPEDLKDDNRNVADHYFVRLRDCCCRLVKVDGQRPLFEFSAAEIEAFAEVEHVRWLAAREINGWRLGVRDDTNKIHHDMIPYAELAEPRKELDRDVVRSLPAVLHEIGLDITRDFGILISAPDTPWTFATQFSQTVVKELQAIKRNAKGQPVLWLNPANAHACCVAELALELRLASVALRLHTSPAMLLAGLPNDAARDSVKTLMRTAERVVLVNDQVQERGSFALEMVISVDSSGSGPAGDGLWMDIHGTVLRRPAGHTARGELD